MRLYLTQRASGNIHEGQSGGRVAFEVGVVLTDVEQLFLVNETSLSPCGVWNLINIKRYPSLYYIQRMGAAWPLERTRRSLVKLRGF